MGASLSVFKLSNFKKEDILGREETSTQNQYTLKDFNIVNEIGDARSSLKFLSYDKDNDRVSFNAVHFTDTIKNSVRVFWEDFEENGVMYPKGTRTVDGGYQQIFKFDVIIDFKTEEIFVFTNKNTALAFMKRFKKSGKLDFEIIRFDLSKIDEIPELNNVWGLWEDSLGNCKKKAYFGTEVHRLDEVEPEKITSYNVNFEYENGSVSLVICKECRISSTSSVVANADLLKIFNALKTRLKKNVK